MEYSEYGSIFSEDLIPGGGGLATLRIGGKSGDEEYILAPNTKHIIRVINKSGSLSDVLVKFVWYEV